MFTPMLDGVLLPLRPGSPPPPGHRLASTYARFEAGEDGFEVTPHGVLLTTEALRAWSDEARAELGLLSYSGSLALREDGVVGHAAYRVRCVWEGGTGTAIGPFLVQGERITLLPPRLADASSTAAALTGLSKVEAFREIARLQALQRQGAALKLGDLLGKRRIRVATRLRIRMESDPAGGAAVPRPVLTSPEGEEIDLAEPELAAVVAGGIRAPAISLLPDGSFVVTEPDVARGALITGFAATASPEERARFGKDPVAFIANDADESAFFDDADYSARVIGVGAAPARPAPPPPQARDWVSADVPKERRVSVPTVSGGSVELSAEQALQLAGVVAGAVNDGRATVPWDGHSVAASPALAEALGTAARMAPPSAAVRPDRRDVVILRIRDNGVDLDWAPALAPRSETHPEVQALRRGLRPHQLEGLARLQDRWRRGERGALLCDDMGLGKTTQALVFSAWAARQLTWRRSPGEKTHGAVDVPVAIVAPRPLLQNWLREIDTVLHDDALATVLWAQADACPNAAPRTMIRLRDYATRGGVGGAVLAEASLDLARIQRQRPSILLVAYDTLRVWQHALGRLHIGVLIADEAQEIKDPASLRSVALRAMHYDFAVMLTGTPVENSWTDLWTLADAAMPGLLGPLAKFKEDFPQDGDLAVHGARLAERLRDPLIRRLRRDVLSELPPLTLRRIEAAMSDSQSIAYLLARSGAAGRRGMLGLLQDLARISLHPRQRAEFVDVPGARAWLNESARCTVLLAALDRWRPTGGAVLVFVRSRAMQATLVKALTLLYGLDEMPVLNGEATDAEKQAMVKRFRGGEGFRVMLVSPDVGGAGWNFQFSSRSVILERPYNPAVEDQMIARTHRLGQVEPVEVVVPVAVHASLRTYDKVLDELLAEKRAAAQGVLAPAAGADKIVEGRLGEAVMG